MIAYSTILFLSIIFAFFYDYFNKKIFLNISFLILFFFLGFRRDYGNDYQAYLDIFNSITLTGDAPNYELLWVMLNKFFSNFGFEWLIFSTSFVSVFAIYRLVFLYCPKSYSWLAVSIYVIYPDLMLIQLSTMRQTLAMSLFLLSITYYKKYFYRYCIAIISSMFHISGIALIFALVFSQICNKFKFFIWIIPLLFFIFYLIPLNEFIIYTLSLNSYLDKFQVYDEGKELNSGLGIFYFGSVAFFLAFVSKKYYLSTNICELFRFGIFKFIWIPFVVHSDVFTRFGIFFDPFIIVLYPIIISSYRNIYQKLIVGIFLLGFIFFRLYLFLSDPINMSFYKDYNNIIFDLL